MRSSFTTHMGLVHKTPNREDLTCVVYRVRFNKNCAGSHRTCAVEIFHPRFSCPKKGAISRRGSGSSNHSPHVVDTERSTGVSTREHPKIIHSTCCSHQRSTHLR